MALKIMILGANGFIGSALTNAILRSRPWEVYGIDLADNKLQGLPQTGRFHFVEGDITINKQRWIYAASKQLLDRVIYAYGVRDNLDYTLFRPFNFIGPNLDNVEEPKEGSSRVFTQFLSNVLHRRPIKLVDGGGQRRSFTYIDDAIECLLTILENENGRASRRIFNIGNPANCISIRDLAERTIRIAQEFPVLRDNARATE